MVPITAANGAKLQFWVDRTRRLTRSPALNASAAFATIWRQRGLGRFEGRRCVGLLMARPSNMASARVCGPSKGGPSSCPRAVVAVRPCPLPAPSPLPPLYPRQKHPCPLPPPSPPPPASIHGRNTPAPACASRRSARFWGGGSRSSPAPAAAPNQSPGTPNPSGPCAEAGRGVWSAVVEGLRDVFLCWPPPRDLATRAAAQPARLAGMGWRCSAPLVGPPTLLPSQGPHTPINARDGQTIRLVAQQSPPGFKGRHLQILGSAHAPRLDLRFACGRGARCSRLHSSTGAAVPHMRGLAERLCAPDTPCPPVPTLQAQISSCSALLPRQTSPNPRPQSPPSPLPSHVVIGQHACAATDKLELADDEPEVAAIGRLNQRGQRGVVHGQALGPTNLLHPLGNLLHCRPASCV